MHAAVYPEPQHAIVGEHLAFERRDLGEVVVGRDLEDPCGAVVDVGAVDVAVVAREDVEDGELFLQVALMRAC